MAKYLLIAAIVISLVTAGLGFMNHGKLVDAVAERDQKATQLTSSQSSLKTAQAAATKATAAIDAADADKVKLASDLSAAQAAATKATGDLDAATKLGAEKDATIADLKQQIAAGPGGIPNPTPGGEDPRIATLTQQVQELTAALESSKTQLSTAQAAVVEYKTKDENREKRLMKKGLEGRILAVNPAWNFVVLSVGTPLPGRK